MDGGLERPLPIGAAAVVQLQHPEAALGEQLQQQRRPVVAHQLHAGAAIDVNDQGRRGGQALWAGEAVVQGLAVLRRNDAELRLDMCIGEFPIGMVAAEPDAACSGLVVLRLAAGAPLGVLWPAGSSPRALNVFAGQRAAQRQPRALGRAEAGFLGPCQAGVLVDDPAALLGCAELVPTGVGQALKPAGLQVQAVEVLFGGRLEPTGEECPLRIGAKYAIDAAWPRGQLFAAAALVAVQMAGAVPLRGPQIVVLADFGEVVVQVDPSGGVLFNEDALA